MKKNDIYLEIGKKTIEWAEMQKEAFRYKTMRGSIDNCTIQSGYPNHESPCVIELRDNQSIGLDECCESCKKFLKLNPEYLKRAYKARGIKISIRSLINKFNKIKDINDKK